MNKEQLNNQYNNVLKSIKGQYPFINYIGDNPIERIINLEKYCNNNYGKTALMNASKSNINSLEKTLSTISLENIGGHYSDYLTSYLTNKFIYHYLSDHNENNTTKNMHFIPQCYIKNFTEVVGNKRIVRFNSINIKSKSTTTVKDGIFIHKAREGETQYEQKLEKYFSDIENDYAVVVNSKIKGRQKYTLSAWSYIVLNAFIIIHQIRHEKNNGEYTVKNMEELLLVQEKYLLTTFKNRYIKHATLKMPMATDKVNIIRTKVNNMERDYYLFPITGNCLYIMSSTPIQGRTFNTVIKKYYSKINGSYTAGKTLYGINKEEMHKIIKSL